MVCSRVVFGALVLSGMVWPRFGGRPARFTEFVPRVLPQSAFGDFDSDGRPDVALIQDGADGRHVSVTMSGSPSVVTLAAPVVSLIAADIDRDGDVDLVAATASGEVVTWLNDSQGHFTVQETSRSQGLTPGAAALARTGSAPPTLGDASPPFLSSDMAETGVVVTRVRPSTAPPAFDNAALLFASLRAPPRLILLG